MQRTQSSCHLNDRYEMKCGLDIVFLLGSSVLTLLCYWVVIDLSVTRANHTAVLPAVMAPHSLGGDGSFLHSPSILKLARTPPPSVTVCGHVVPPGQACMENRALSFHWLFSRNCFASVCLRFWWSIINPSNGHSWGFVPSLSYPARYISLMIGSFISCY